MPASCRAAASLSCRDCRRYGARRATRTIPSAHDVRAFFSLSIGSDPFCASSAGTPSIATAQGGLRPRGRLRLPHGFVRSSERSLLSTSKANISPIASTKFVDRVRASSRPQPDAEMGPDQADSIGKFRANRVPFRRGRGFNKRAITNVCSQWRDVRFGGRMRTALAAPDKAMRKTQSAARAQTALRGCHGRRPGR